MINTKDILEIFPSSIKNILIDIKSFKLLQEIRIKVNKPLILYVGQDEIITTYITTIEDIKTIVQRISNYSIYAIEDELKQGYITIKGGHRVGICGDCVIEDNRVKTIKNITSLNIRVCKEVLGCSEKIMPYIIADGEILNTIIISPPKSGKTTILRDIARNISMGIGGLKGKKVCVVDERSEIGGCYYGIPQMNLGLRTDILDNCPKSEGIMMAIRSMSPDVIVCDEIGTYKDMESIIMALNSGISLITTIHGFGVEDLYKRKVFDEIIENRVFKRAIVLSCSRGVGTVEYIFDFSEEKMIWRNQDDRNT